MIKENSNARTLATYNAHIQDYVDNTPNEVSDLAEIWLDAAIENLEKNAKILEIGTAIGHDANYIEHRGFTVERTDAAQGFIALLQEQGHDAKLLNILTDKIVGLYDLILADAVLPHFTYEEALQAIQSSYNALVSDGKFAFSLRIGEREGWSDEKIGAPRYFRYWSRSDIEVVLRAAGFKNIRLTDGDIPNSSWLHIIARKS